MSGSIVQQIASFNVGTQSPWPYILFGGSGLNVTGGSTLVLFWSAPYANTLESIRDNYGNSWSQVPSAAYADPVTGYDGEFWIATNVAQETSSNSLTLTFTYNGSASSEACVWGIEVEGAKGATVSTGGSFSGGADTDFSVPPLNGDGGALYFEGLAGTNAAACTVEAPWSIDIDSAKNQSYAVVATLAGQSGFQQPTFIPNPSFSGVGVGCILIGGTNGIGGGYWSGPGEGCILHTGRSVPAQPPLKPWYRTYAEKKK